VRHRFERGCEGAVQFLAQARAEIVGQRAAELGFDFKRGFAQRPAEKPFIDLLRRDRKAVAGQQFSVGAAGQKLAIDQDAVAVENNEIDSCIQDLSSSNGTQYSSSR
jgi:hypothetical protein